MDIPQPQPEVGSPMPQPGSDPSQMFQQGDGTPISDEKKQELLDMIEKIRAKMAQVGATRFATGNKSEALRRSLLKQVFEKLQMAGVDLTDQNAVGDFIAKLQESNPELAAMFEKSMDVLLGGDTEPGFQAPFDPKATIDLGIPPQNMNNTNPNETLPQAP